MTDSTTEREGVSEILAEIKDGKRQGVTIPMLVLIVAICGTLIGLAGWSLNLETRKADRTDVAEIRSDLKQIIENKASKADLAGIQSDLKTIINMHLRDAQ
jgi:hypothetical protein